MHKKTWKRALFALVSGTTFISLGSCLQAALTAIPIGAGFTLGADLSQSLGLGSLLPALGGN